MRIPSLRFAKLSVFLAAISLSTAAVAATKHVTVGASIMFTDQTSGTSNPALTTIVVGDTVEWDWAGGSHTTTSGTCSGSCTPDGLWDSPQMGSGSFSHTFTSTGTFHYFCRPHGALMTGTITVTPPPDFSMAISNSNGGTAGGPIFPSQQTVFNGSLNSLNGYNNSVSLSCQMGASPLPSPCIPSPATPMPSTSFMITAGAATPGHYDFMARASDGTITHSVSGLNFDVVDFGIAAPAPSSVSVLTNPAAMATSGSTSINLTGVGTFSGMVTLACPSGLPANATCNFTPAGPYSPTASTPVSVNATVTVPAATMAQDYNVMVAASSTSGAGMASKSQPLTLHVVDFNVASPAPSAVTAFVNTTSSAAALNLSAVGPFGGSVALSCSSGLPAGATCGFAPSGPYTPTLGSPVNVTLTIAVPVTSTPQDYNVTVSATSSGVTKNQPLTLHVVQFSASALAPNPVTIGAGNLSNAASTTLTAANFVNPGTVTMTCTAGLPAGGTCSFSPNNGLATSFPSAQSVVVSVPMNTPGGSLNVTVAATGSSGGVVLAHNQSLTVNIPAPALSLSTPSPASVSMVNNSFSRPITVQVTPTNLAGTVTLSCGNLPAGVSCLFSPSATVNLAGRPASFVVAFEANGAATPIAATNITINADATINSTPVSTSVGVTELDITAPGTSTDVTLNVTAVNSVSNSALINIGDPNLKITASVNNSGSTYGAAAWNVGFSNPVTLVPGSAINATCTQILATEVSCNLGDVPGGSSSYSFNVAPLFERSLVAKNLVTSSTVGDSNLADNASTPDAVQVRPRPLARKGLVPKTP